MEDGSYAQYQQTGSGTDKHYKFTGFKSENGMNTVNLTIVIQEQQNLNESNSSLEPDASRYCNYATQNVLKIELLIRWQRKFKGSVAVSFIHSVEDIYKREKVSKTKPDKLVVSEKVNY